MTTTNTESTFDALNAIADKIAPFEPEYQAAWANLDNDSTVGTDDFACIKAATLRLNTEIEKHVDEIARITGNSVSTIHQCYCPKEEFDVWFGISTMNTSPSEFLKKVAQHQTFNTDRWDQLEMASAREALLARVKPSAPISIKAAAEQIKNDQVPHLLERDVPVNHSYFPSTFEKALLENGCLEPYDKMNVNHISSTRPFAYVVHSTDAEGQDRQQFVFWPEKRSNHHLQFTPLDESLQEALPEELPAPRH